MSTSDFELPGMWESADFTGGADEERGGHEPGPTCNPECHPDLVPKSTALIRKADAAQYEREPIPEEQRGQIRVRLLNATPDPLGSIAALCAQYEGRVIRNLSEVTDDQRLQALEDMTKTVLNGPLEAAQFHFQIEGVTRSITHQMVRARASFFAQESLRFAVPEGDWSEEIPLPPSLAGTKGGEPLGAESSEAEYARNLWDESHRNAARSYAGLIEAGVPAEEARGVIPHDMPTRIHMVCDLRQLLAEAGKRTCTQAQFPWRMIFAGIANALRERAMHAPSAMGKATYQRPNFAGRISPAFDGWQFQLIADKIRPVCYQTGSCGFMAKFDRSCNIRSRVDAFAQKGIPSSQWGQEYDAVEGNPIVSGVGPQSVVRNEQGQPVFIGAINDAEWALNPGAARS